MWPQERLGHATIGGRMTSVKITSDGKGKRHSFEATVEVHGSTPDAHWTFAATGYGDGNADALRAFREALRAMMAIEREVAQSGEISAETLEREGVIAAWSGDT